MSVRFWCLLLQAVLIVQSVAVAQQGRPPIPLTRRDVAPQVSAALDRGHPGWELLTIDAQTRQICGNAVKRPFGPSIVWADFDGNGQQDYAVRIVERNRTRLVALMGGSAGTGMKEVNLEDEEGKVTWASLSISPKGEPYFDHERQLNGKFALDTVTLNYCEKSAVAFVYDNGSFRKVWISD